VAEALPISVWATAQQSPRAQRAGRYLAPSMAHPARMLPAIAATAIDAYSGPGDVVLDPMCGVGTTLVEAVHLGRDAVGIEFEDRWAEVSRANLAHARAQGASGAGEVTCGDGRFADALVDEALRGLVGLVLTSPPYGPSVHGRVRARPGQGVAKADFSYSADPANLARLGGEVFLSSLSEILAASARVLRRGGILAMTLRPFRHRGKLVDLPGAMGRLAEPSGLVLFERNVALLAGVRDGRLVPRSSFFALDQVRRARRRGVPELVIAHEDVIVLRKPE
jgi:modification methylase